MASAGYRGRIAGGRSDRDGRGGCRRGRHPDSRHCLHQFPLPVLVKGPFRLFQFRFNLQHLRVFFLYQLAEIFPIWGQMVLGAAATLAMSRRRRYITITMR